MACSQRSPKSLRRKPGVVFAKAYWRNIEQDSITRFRDFRILYGQGFWYLCNSFSLHSHSRVLCMCGWGMFVHEGSRKEFTRDARFLLSSFSIPSIVKYQDPLMLFSCNSKIRDWKDGVSFTFFPWIIMNFKILRLGVVVFRILGPHFRHEFHIRPHATVDACTLYELWPFF